MAGRASSAAARAVSRELRTSDDPRVVARRRSALCSLGASAILGVLSSYQLGLIRHLPDPPRGPFASDAIDGSGEAYWILSAADAPIGLANFAVTAALAGSGGKDRATEHPELVLAWGAKLAIDAVYSVLLALEQPLLYRKLCWYCLGVTTCSVAAVIPARHELRTAWAQRRG